MQDVNTSSKNQKGFINTSLKICKIVWKIFTAALCQVLQHLFFIKKLRPNVPQSCITILKGTNSFLTGSPKKHENSRQCNLLTHPNQRLRIYLILPPAIKFYDRELEAQATITFPVDMIRSTAVVLFLLLLPADGQNSPSTSKVRFGDKRSSQSSQVVGSF